MVSAVPLLGLQGILETWRHLKRALEVLLLRHFAEPHDKPHHGVVILNVEPFAVNAMLGQRSMSRASAALRKMYGILWWVRRRSGKGVAF